MSHIVVVVNGEFAREAQLLAVLRKAGQVIAADGGANWLLAHGLAPDVLIGDLDSVDAQTLAQLEATGCAVQRFSPHKDETDAELALVYAAAQRPESITLLGALGGRVDHALANLMLLALPELRGIVTTIYDGHSWVRLIEAESASIHGAAGDLVSLLAWGGDCQGVTTCDMQYPLEDEPLLFGPARGISNVLLGPRATVTVRAGRLLIVHTPQQAAGAV